MRWSMTNGRPRLRRVRSDTTLVCLGLGYCASHYVAEFGGRFERIIGTTRTAERAGTLAVQHFGGRAVEMLVFDGRSVPPELSAAIARADALLISAAPAETGDPILTVLADEIARAPQLRSVVLLSTIGVYPDSAGAWIDETAEVAPRRARGGSARVEAEAAWQALGVRKGVAVAVLRLGAIYGPGQNMMVRLLRGPVPRIAKPGHVLNRIHVFDIAQAIAAAVTQRADGIFNIVDDEPASPSEVTAFAAKLIGVEPAPEIPYAEAATVLSPAALSFYEGCIRAKNDKLKTMLGVKLRYPNYREGLQALYEAGGHLAAGEAS
jgi:nucleoside-diphosphate-sugar epimerase